MRNLFTDTDNHDILKRIDELQPGSKPLWGKMSVAQMLVHCVQPIKVALGEHQLKHSLIGKLFGRRFKNKMMQEEYVFEKNLPTAKSFVVKNEPDFYASREALKENIQHFFNADKNEMTARPHPFFGKMTVEEWGILGYKHLDHHLRQFGV